MLLSNISRLFTRTVFYSPRRLGWDRMGGISGIPSGGRVDTARIHYMDANQTYGEKAWP